MKNTSDQKKSEMVLNAFQTCHQRISIRRRWNMLFSLLIPVCMLWLGCVLAHQFHLIPFGDTVSRTVLGVGTVGVLFVTWRTRTDPSYAAYVFDQMNQFDGAFITWFSGRAQEARETPVQTALLLEIHNRLSQKTTLPNWAFPAGKAFATAGLLSSGVLAGLALDPTDQSALTGPTTSSRQAFENDEQDRSARNEVKTSSSDEQNDQLVEKQADELLRQLNRLKKEVARTQKEGQAVSDELVQRKERLQRKMRSFLEKNDPSSSAAPPSKPGSGEATEKKQADSSRNSSQQPDPTKESTPSENGKDSSSSQRSQEQNTQNSAIDKIKKIYQTLAREPVFDTSDVDTSEAEATNGSNRSGTSLNIPESNDVENSEASIVVSSDELNDALHRSNGVRDWSPKYDRSIEAYRSFLRTYIQNRESNENIR